MRGQEEIFLAALDLSADERATFLEQACGHDEDLRSQIVALLRAHEKAQQVFSVPVVPTSPLASEKPGQVIGRYRLLEKIGEGGCGVVWMAEQQQPVRRRVALKVIKLGMDTSEVIARFGVERQALAMMDHPNIARVHDAGATDAGRPFFVMELVRGIPITKYCDENQLVPAARLELFIQVCHAVQHAHQKGIIHRDLKPSNILVAVSDGVPTPKVIDFGIAKATQGKLTDATVFTAFEQFIGTPAYMSPEQAELSSLDVDTRSDIYSLGVLLYELLAGKAPFDTAQLAQVGIDEVRRQIRELEPARPSARLRRLADDERIGIARLRATAPTQLAMLLRGDLDWIVMRCIEKDRTRRYDTANGLAADLRRHLRHEPVVARPPSTTYLLQKFIRRHQVGFAAGAAIAAVLVLGATLSTWQMIRATRAEQEQSRLREAAQEARAAAEKEKLDARRRAYASDMLVAHQALIEDNYRRARPLLDRHRPKPGETDLRGWEWRYLWQMSRDEFESVLPRGAEYVSSVTASADGKWVAMAPGPVIWNWQTRAMETIALPGSEGFTHVAFSPREPLLAVVAYRRVRTRVGMIVLWDAAARQVVREWVFNPGEDYCTGLHFNADGQTLATSTAGTNNEIRLWRVDTGELLASFPTGHTSGQPRYAHFAVTGDMKRAAFVAAGAAEVQVLDLITGRSLWSARPGPQNTMALGFSPDGKVLAVGQGFQESPVWLFDAATGNELGRLVGHRRGITQFAFWPDGKTLASIGGDQTVRIWDLPSRSLVRTLHGHTDEVHSLALLPDHRTLVSGSKNGEVLIWNIAERAETRSLVKISGPVVAWRFSADGDAVITLTHDGRLAEHRGPHYESQRTLFQLKLRDGARLFTDYGLITSMMEGLAVTTGATILAKDAPLLAHTLGKNEIEVWDWQRGERLAVLAQNNNRRLSPVSFMGGGKKLLIGRLAEPGVGVVREEWDVSSGERGRIWAAGARQAWPTEFSVFLAPDEKRFISVVGAETLVRTDLNTGRATELNLDVSAARTLGVFSPDGSLFALPTWKGIVQVVSVDPFRSVTTLSGFVLAVHSAGFSPDGRRLATASGGQEAMTLWDVGTYERLLTLAAERSQFRQTAFSADGNMLGAIGVYGGGPRVLHLWRAPSWAEIAAAEESGPQQKR